MVHKRYRNRKLKNPADSVKMEQTKIIIPEISHESKFKTEGSALFTKKFERSNPDVLRREILSKKLNFTQKPDIQLTFKLMRRKARSNHMYNRLCSEYKNSYKPILDNPMDLYILPYSQQQILILDMGYKMAQFIEKSQICYRDFATKGDDVLRKRKLLEIESDFERKLAFLKTFHCNIKDSHYRNSIRSAWLLNEF